MFLLLIGVFIIFLALIYFFFVAPEPIKVDLEDEEPLKYDSRPGMRSFSLDELKRYNGEDSPLIYIAVKNNVFDVSDKGKIFT